MKSKALKVFELDSSKLGFPKVAFLLGFPHVCNANAGAFIEWLIKKSLEISSDVDESDVITHNQQKEGCSSHSDQRKSNPY